MAYTNTDTNMTTSSALSAGMQTYYNRELLRTFEPNLVHLQFGDEHRMPPHSGLVMNMRKIIPLETNTKALSEGDPGDSVMLAETEVTVQLQQYGEYARCTDKLDLTHLDMDIMRRTKLFGDAGSRSIDAVVREELAKCANVIYAGGKTSRAALTPQDKLTSRELRRAVKMLKKNHAQTFGGYYIAIVGPDTMYDLQEDDAFIKVSQYQDKENIYTGEIGRLFGVRLVETDGSQGFRRRGRGEGGRGKRHRTGSVCLRHHEPEGGKAARHCQAGGKRGHGRPARPDQHGRLEDGRLRRENAAAGVCGANRVRIQRVRNGKSLKARKR